jgi:uncharacterized protein
MISTDSGFWLALANPKDSHHSSAVEALARVNEPLITTWPVITETSYLLLKALGNSAQVQFIDKVAGKAFQIYGLQPDQAPRISQLMKQYSDLPMDLADASLVILAEHLGHGRILSADQRDFNTYRWKNREPFENLMFPI